VPEEKDMAKGTGRVVLLLAALLEGAGAAYSAEPPTDDEGLSEVVVTDVAHAAPNVNIEQAGSGFGKSAFVSIRG
jgi:hypothetical protein